MNPSSQERERLILEHLPQVRLIARRIHARLPANVSLDDLVSTGILGLIAAVDRFDASRNLSLKTYAEHKIRGKILDSLRDLDWAPREQRKRARRICAATTALEQRLHRAPAEEEIAAELHLPLETYHRWQLRASGLNLGQLESAGSSDSEGHDLLRSVSNDPDQWPLAIYERRELQAVLAAAIAGIPKMERAVLSLHYHEELTLREISKIVCLHESRISQIRERALRRLRGCMSTLGPGTAAKNKPQSGKPSGASPRSRTGRARVIQYSALAC